MGDEVFTTYDLVSRGKDITDKNQCYGSYRSSDGYGMGGGYVNPCIHSGLIKTSGDIATTWYNYSLASAGTIENSNIIDYQSNTIPATESICPKGWTLPNTAQIHTIGDNTPTYTSSFLPVLGGYFYNGTQGNEDTRGYLWNSEANSGASRYYLIYNGSSLYTGALYRNHGFYIRCINKQKTVLDLTYMQEMTPEIASIPPPC